MSSQSERGSKSGSGSSERQSLPFEPSKNRKAERQVEKQVAKPPVVKTTQTSQPAATRKADASIPDAISRRMAKRMAFFCGIPTALGMSTFVVSYIIVSNDIVNLPTYAVLLVSLGFFGLGVLGLSYGALSASWDEEMVGSRLGFTEFGTNWGRMTGAWKATREEAREATRKKS